MHEEDEADRLVGTYYGVWPTFAGLMLAAALIWFMFTLADGFS